MSIEGWSAPRVQVRQTALRTRRARIWDTPSSFRTSPTRSGVNAASNAQSLSRHNVRNESVVIQARSELLATELDGDHADYAATIEQSVGRLVDSGRKARTLAEAGAGGATPNPLCWPTSPPRS